MIGNDVDDYLISDQVFHVSLVSSSLAKEDIGKGGTLICAFYKTPYLYKLVLAIYLSAPSGPRISTHRHWSHVGNLLFGLGIQIIYERSARS